LGARKRGWGPPRGSVPSAFCLDFPKYKLGNAEGQRPERRRHRGRQRLVAVENTSP